MPKTIKRVLLSFFLLTLFGCSSLNNTTNDNEKKRKPEYRLQAGINHGGIIENTDLSVDDVDAYSGATEKVEADAFTGATKLGANAGVHILFPVRKNYIETGIDFMFSNQTLNYNDDVNGYFGKREIGTSQFLVPVTYNLGLIRKRYSEGLFQIKLGYVLQYNIFNISDNGNSLPEYSTKDFSSGIAFGFATTPFTLANGSKIGLYLDLYRGSPMYDDFYNGDNFDMRGSGYLKVGIIYHFKTQ